MDKDLKELLSVLNANNVKFVVVGGYAVFVHAQPRMTKDLDVFIESSVDNARVLYRALTQFGAPLQDFTLRDFHTPTTIARFGTPPICFDILQTIDGVDFSTVYAHSQIVMVDDDLPVRYISADDLITNKLASGRPQDLADVEAIRHRRRVTREN